MYLRPVTHSRHFFLHFAQIIILNMQDTGTGTGPSRYDKQLCFPKSFVCEALNVMSPL